MYISLQLNTYITTQCQLHPATESFMLHRTHKARLHNFRPSKVSAIF